jgi:hypothetical protein
MAVEVTRFSRQLHQPAIPSHVGGQNGCQPTLDAWFRAVLLHQAPLGLLEEGCHDDLGRQIVREAITLPLRMSVKGPDSEES